MTQERAMGDRKFAYVALIGLESGSSLYPLGVWANVEDAKSAARQAAGDDDEYFDFAAVGKYQIGSRVKDPGVPFSMVVWSTRDDKD